MTYLFCSFLIPAADCIRIRIHIHIHQFVVLIDIGSINVVYCWDLLVRPKSFLYQISRKVGAGSNKTTNDRCHILIIRSFDRLIFLGWINVLLLLLLVRFLCRLDLDMHCLLLLLLHKTSVHLHYLDQVVHICSEKTIAEHRINKTSYKMLH